MNEQVTSLVSFWDLACFILVYLPCYVLVPWGSVCVGSTGGKELAVMMSLTLGAHVLAAEVAIAATCCANAHRLFGIIQHYS